VVASMIAIEADDPQLLSLLGIGLLPE
jgi:hypothetical protein